MTAVILCKAELTALIRDTVKETLGYKEKILHEEFDFRYKNVKLLMKNYRKLKLYYQEVKPETAEVDSIFAMQRKTGLIMSHVDKMLAVYKTLCQESCEPEQQRRWKALYLRYIDERKLKIESIAEFLRIDKRTFYRDISQAMNELAVLLFGIEALGTWKHKG